MAHYRYVNGLKFDVLSIHQDKPQTTVRIKHVCNGVTYEAKRQALWDGDDEWNVGEGVRIAFKRAVRSITRRLAWEAGAGRRADQAKTNAYHLCNSRDVVNRLRRDGGTVQL